MAEPKLTTIGKIFQGMGSGESFKIVDPWTRKVTVFKHTAHLTEGGKLTEFHYESADGRTSGIFKADAEIPEGIIQPTIDRRNSRWPFDR